MSDWRINLVSNEGVTEWSLVVPINDATSSLLKAFTEIMNLQAIPEPFKEASNNLFKRFQVGWLYELCWVLKDKLKLWEHSDPPFNTPMAQAYESAGKIHIATLNLCEACLYFFPNLYPPVGMGAVDFLKPALKVPAGDSYSLEFWRLVTLEVKLKGLMHLSGGSLKDVERKARLKIQRLASWENLYHPGDLFWLHNYNLINAALTIGKYQLGDSRELMRERKIFQDLVWTPYLAALRQNKHNVKNGVGNVVFRCFEVKGNALIVKLGGRETATVVAPPKKNLSNRGRKTAQNRI